MRKAKPTDFFVEVPDVGTFRFGRRTYGDRLQIRAEFLRVVRELDTGETDDDGQMVLDAELSGHASIVAAYKVLCVECPDGWEDLEALDLTADPGAEDRILDVYVALRGKEDSFRLAKGADEGGKDEGAGAVALDGAVVPAPVPA